MWALVAAVLVSGVVFLDGSLVSVALPAIGRDLDAGLSGLQWISNAYTLALAALLILGGSLGDQYGRRRVMGIGLAGYAAACVAAGLAPSMRWLTAARLVQGAAAALLVPCALAVLRAAYTAPEARGRAIGLWSGWSGAGTVVGPLLSGWLVDALSWRWVFFFEVPIVAVSLWLLVAHVRESRAAGLSPGLDWAGAALATVGLGGAAFGLIEGPVMGWANPLVVAGLAGGLLALLLFVLVEARVRHPMVPLHLFRSRNFTGANLTTLGVYLAVYGVSFFLVIYLQNVMRYPALLAGLVLAPLSLLLLLLSPRFGSLAGRQGPRLFMFAGPVVCAVGLLLLLRLQPDSSLWTGPLPAVLVFGLGLAATVAPLTNTVVSSVPERHSGVSVAFNSAVSRVAALLAVAGLGVVVNGVFGAALAERTTQLSLGPEARAILQDVAKDPTGAVDAAELPSEVLAAVDAAYTVAFHWTMAIGAAAALAGGLTAAATIRNPPHRP